MGITFLHWFVLFCTLNCRWVAGADNVQLNDPHLLEVAKFAVSKLTENEDLELDNYTLMRVLDSQFTQAIPPSPNLFILILEMGNTCNPGENCPKVRKICEVSVLDEPSSKTMAVLDAKSDCRFRESSELLFSGGKSTTIARSMSLDDPQTKSLVEGAVKQMSAARKDALVLKHLASVRKVEEGNSISYYLSLYVSPQSDESARDVCEVTMEEDVKSKEQTLQSLQCFATGDDAGNAKLGVIPITEDDLPTGMLNNAIVSSLAVIDTESPSQFQLKVIAYLVAEARASLDSGTRELNLKLGLVPTLCIKHSDSEEDATLTRPCPIDLERSPSICSIALTQWPWVSETYLFSDLECRTSTYTAISDELDSYSEDDSSSESGSEQEETSANIQKPPSRVEEKETDDESKQVEDSDVAEEAPCLGCATALDPEGDQVKEMASFALTAIEELVNSQNAQSVVRVINATRQVVSGLKYDLTLEIVETDCSRAALSDRTNCKAVANGLQRVCSVSIIEQPWIGPKKILETSCLEPKDAAESPTSDKEEEVPDVPVTGQEDPVPLDDEEVLKMARFALEKLDAADENDQKRVLVRVLEATKQVVSGSRYVITMEVAVVDCPEESDSSDPACEVPDESEKLICKVSGVHQPWEEVPRQLVDSNCNPSEEKSDPSVETHSKPHLLGAIEPSEKDSEYIREIAQFATSALNERSNDRNSIKLIRVLDARTQIVAGVNVFLDVEVGFTTCGKGIESVDGCQLDESRPPVTCHVTVWDRAWLKDRQVTKLDCDDLAMDSADVSTDSTDAVEAQEDVAATTQGPTTDTITDTEIDDSEEPVVAPQPVSEPPIVAESPVSPEKDDPVADQIQGYSDFALAVIQEHLGTKDKIDVIRLLASSIQNVADYKSIRLSLEVGSAGCPDNGQCGESGSYHEPQVCNVHIKEIEGQSEVAHLQCGSKPSRKWQTALAVESQRRRRSEDIDESPFVGEVPPSFRFDGFIIPDWPNPKFKKTQERPSAKPKKKALSYLRLDTDDVKTQEIASLGATLISQSADLTGPLHLKVLSAERQENLLNYRIVFELEGSDINMTCQVVIKDADVQEMIFSNCDALRRVRNFQVQKDLDDDSSQSTSSESIEDLPAVDDVATFQRFQVPPPEKILTGGFKPVDIDTKDILDTASFVAMSSNFGLNFDSRTWLLNRIVAARVRNQIAGSVTKIIVQLAAPDTTSVQECRAQVFHHYASGNRAIISRTCSYDIGDLPEKPVPANTGDSVTKETVVGNYDLTGNEDPHLQKVTDFATRALANFLDSSLTLTNVAQAKKQIVAGANYKLKLNLNGADGRLKSCRVSIFHQPWTETFKLIESSCDPNVPNEKQAAPAETLDELRDAESNETVGLVIDRLMEYFPVALKVSDIKSAQKIPANGETYLFSAHFSKGGNVTRCSILINHNVWLLPYELSSAKVTCGENEEKIEDQSLVKTPAEVESLIPFATKVLNFVYGGDFAFQGNARLLSSSVAGFNYNLAFDVQGADGVQHCKTLMFQRPGTLTGKVLVDFDCFPIDSESQSSYQNVDVSDPEVEEMAQFVTELINEASSSPFKRLKITSAKKQTIVGDSYKLDIDFATSENIHSCAVTTMDFSLTSRKIGSFHCAVRSEIDGTMSPTPSAICSDCTRHVDVNDPEVQAAAEFAGAAMDNSIGGMRLSKVKAAEVGVHQDYKVTAQYVTDSSIIVCQVVVDQKATGRRELSRSFCSQPLQWLLELRQKRSVDVFQTGDESDAGKKDSLAVDPSDLHILELASFAATLISQAAKMKQPVRLEITSAEKVDDSKYRIQLQVQATGVKLSCQAEVSDGAHRELTYSSCDGIRPAQKPKKNRRPKPTRIGAYSDFDVDHPKIREIADFAVGYLNGKLNDGPWDLIKIRSAQTQIVAGTNYKLMIDLNASDAYQTCTVVVFDQPWTSTRTVTSEECVLHDSETEITDPAPAFVGKEVKAKEEGERFAVSPPKTTLDGGFRPLDIDSPESMELAVFAVEAGYIKEDDREWWTLQSVLSAEVRDQVAGSVHRVIVQAISPFTGSVKECEAEIFSHPSGKRRLSRCNCFVSEEEWRGRKKSPDGDSIVTPKKTLLGPYYSVSPDDPEVQSMAEFVLASLEKDFNSKLTLINVTKASRKIRAGVDYKLSMLVRGDDEDWNCNVDLFYQLWTETMQVTDHHCNIQSPSKERKDSDSRSVDVDDPETRKLAAYVLDGFLFTYPVALNIENISSVESEMVYGSLIGLGLDMWDENKRVVSCRIDVYLRAWTSARDFVKDSIECEEKPAVSGESEKEDSPVDFGPNYRELSHYAADKINLVLGKNLKLKAIADVTADPRRGKNFKFDMVLKSLDGSQHCNVLLYERDWAAFPKQIATFDCFPVFSEGSPDSRPYSEYHPIETDDSDVQEIATFATDQMNEGRTADNHLRRSKITSAGKRTVVGDEYHVTVEFVSLDTTYTCDIITADRSYITRKLAQFECQTRHGVDVEDSAEPSPVEEEPVVPLKSHCTGCYSPADPNDPTIQEMANFAATAIGESTNSGPVNLLKITAAEIQVVAGFNYKMTLHLDGDSGIIVCQVIVFDQSWTGRRELHKSMCSEPYKIGRRKREADLVGGSSEMNLDDPKLKELTDFILTTIEERSNNANPPSMVRLIKASKQLVSGTLFTLDMEIGTDCQSISLGCHQRCTATIWDQPWTDKREVTKLSCKNMTKNGQKSRYSSRNLLGGITPADPQSDSIQSVASFALHSIQSQTNADYRLRIVRIKNAATQVVGGQNVFLTLEIGQTKCKTNEPSQDCPFDDKAERQLCKVKIWSRPWLGERQILDQKCRPLSFSACKWKNCNQRSKRQHQRDGRRRNQSGSESRRLQHMRAFRSFISKFNRVYTSWAEFEKRYKIYRANQKRIELLNLHEKGTATYGDTEFSDLSEDEFKKRHTGLKPLLRRPGTTLDRAVIPNIHLPDEFDWRNYNIVTPVKDQGQCGSCWAFSVTGNVEGLYGIKHGQLISLSEQELVDCDKLDSGCNGGLPENAYKAIQDLGGLETESDYPYNGHQNQCHLNRTIAQVQVSGAVEISKNETEMAQWLMKNGPISIGINANGMQFYRGGISHPWKVLCRPGGIDHGVLIVGFGVSSYPKFNKTMPYWIVKNSWGTRWGEQGYYRVYRGDGTCGLNEMATSAVVV